MSILVLLRHGQSNWNVQQRFAGWVDTPLTKQGREQALAAAEDLKSYKFDRCFSSNLIRAIDTALICLTEYQKPETENLMVVRADSGPQAHFQEAAFGTTTKRNILLSTHNELNERYYGDVQGVNKEDGNDKYKAEEVRAWRKSYDVAPPNGESLQMTADRVLPFFQNTVVPALSQYEKVLLAAHGDVLRCLCQFIEGLSQKEVEELHIATARGRIYEYKNKIFTRQRWPERV